MQISGIVGESISGFVMTRVTIERFPQGEKLPKIKPIMGPLRGFALSEVPTPSGPPLTPTSWMCIPVEVESRGMAGGCITPWPRPYWTPVP